VIQKKTHKLGKKHLAIIISILTLILLITAYVLVDLLVPIMSDEQTETQKAPPEILENEGEALVGNLAVIYPYVTQNKMVSLNIKSDKGDFIIEKELDKDGKIVSDFILSYFDENGKKYTYAPAIVEEDADFQYSDLYAIEQGDGLGTRKLDYLCAAVGALYFDERIALSKNEQTRSSELYRYGLDKESRETIELVYLDSDGKTQKHTVHIGNKLITKVGYYFMLEGRDYIYTSTASNTLSYALSGFETFINPRIIAEEMPGDKTAAPYHTTEYTQWISRYYSALDEDNKFLTIPYDAEVIINANYRIPLYTSVSSSGSDETIDENGYRFANGLEITLDLSSRSSTKEMAALMKNLVGKKLGKLEVPESYTVITDMNEATLYDAENDVGAYEYTIYEVEAVLTDKGDVTAIGTSVPDGAKIRVKYGYTLSYKDSKTGEKKLVSQNDCHAIIDLSSESVISEDIKNALKNSGVGALSSPISFNVKYTEENANKKKVDYVITSISNILEVDDKNQTVKYADTVSENSLVVYTFHYLLDGEMLGEESTMWLPLADVASDSYYQKIKEALIGKKLGEQTISVKDNIYCQPFMDFGIYEITDILGYIEKQTVVSFSFAKESDRNSFLGESIYKNILPSYHPHSAYALNDETCDEVLRLLGGIAASSTSSGAVGLVGSKTEAIGLTQANMEKYKLYDGYRIYFELPRGLDTTSVSNDYEWLDSLNFTLYIGKEVQEDGTVFVGCDMYDIIVRIDASVFDYLRFSFPEHWARRNLAMIDVSNIEKVTLDLNFDKIYGSYEFDLIHTDKYIVNGIPQNTKPEGNTNFTEYDFITVNVKPLSDRISDTFFSRILKEYGIDSFYLENIYNRAAGLVPGVDAGLSVDYDTLGTASFKEQLRIMYSTYYLGVVDKADQAKANEQNRLMQLTFDLGDTNEYTYRYSFYRIDDRRIMVSLTRIDMNGVELDPVSDFYISTPAFKKIVANFENLLNGVELNPDVMY